MGTQAFINFVKDIEAEGVVLTKIQMGESVSGSEQGETMDVYVETDNPAKPLASLDILFPILGRRFAADYSGGRLASFVPEQIEWTPIALQVPELVAGTTIIRWVDILNKEESHQTILNKDPGYTYTGILNWYKIDIAGRSGYTMDQAFIAKLIDDFIRDFLFTRKVEPTHTDADKVLLWNLTRTEVSIPFKEAFVRALKIHSAEEKILQPQLYNYKAISNMRLFQARRVNNVYFPMKSLQNLIYEQNNTKFEPAFAALLDRMGDVEAFAKNYWAVQFKLDYQDTDKHIREYWPDFFVKTFKGKIYVVETKGQQQHNTHLKHARLLQWCEDANRFLGEEKYHAVFVPQKLIEEHQIDTFEQLASIAGHYQPRVE